MIISIQEFEDAMKSALQSIDTLVPASTQIIFRIGDVEFLAQKINIKDKKIIVEIRLK